MVCHLPYQLYGENKKLKITIVILPFKYLRSILQYPAIPSTSVQVPHDDELPIPVPPAEHMLISISNSSSTLIDDDVYQNKHETREPIPFNQETLQILLLDI